jgi:hypothetical protein
MRDRRLGRSRRLEHTQTSTGVLSLALLDVSRYRWLPSSWGPLCAIKFDGREARAVRKNCAMEAALKEAAQEASVAEVDGPTL